MKMKSLLLACATACTLAAPAMAEGGMFSSVLDSNWTADVVASVKYNYYNFANWQQDGTSNYTWIISYDADVQGKWKVANWRNLVNLALGKTWTDGLGQRKSTDKIFWESMVDFNMTEVLKPYVGNRFESQFLSGYSYSEDEEGNEVKTAISCFMDPAYETQVAGLAYIPNEMFSQRIGFANRMTISNGYGFADDKDTEDKIEKFKDEPGLESITEFKYSYLDIATFKSSLRRWYLASGSGRVGRRWIPAPLTVNRRGGFFYARSAYGRSHLKVAMPT